MKRVKLDKEKIDQLFKEKKDSGEIIVELFKTAIPNFDKVKKIHGYLKVSKKTNEYLFEKFIEFDKKNKPGILPGGAWLNYGFSSYDSNIIDDFVVEYNETMIEYKGVDQ
ncbi:MAG: hypothetical protein ACTSO2_20105 [Promethearchaeota archaeon]